jgi:ribonuclease P protein component
MSRIEHTTVGRITDSREIVSLRRNGEFFRCGAAHVWASRSVSGSPCSPRVAVVTGKRFANAVLRNKAKRRVRGCVMDLRRLLTPGTSYLIECRRGALEMDYQTLVNDLKRVLSRDIN